MSFRNLSPWKKGSEGYGTGLESLGAFSSPAVTSGINHQKLTAGGEGYCPPITGFLSIVWAG